MSFTQYLDANRDQLITLTVQHARLCLFTIAVAGLLGVVIGAVVHAVRPLAAAVVGATAALFTIPSLAMVGLLIPVTGLTETTVLVMLLPYGVIPIIRNTVTGLQTVDALGVEAARAMGMGPIRVLLAVKLPLAWPAILAGLRVATQLVLGVAALAVYVTRIGLGVLIDAGLARFGLPNATNQALAGTAGIVLLAITFDLAWQLVGRLTISRGIRA